MCDGGPQVKFHFYGEMKSIYRRNINNTTITFVDTDVMYCYNMWHKNLSHLGKMCILNEGSIDSYMAPCATKVQILRNRIKYLHYK